MDVTTLMSTSGDSSEDLIGLVDDISLDVGQITFAEEMEDLDACAEEDLKTTVRIEADPPSEIPCFDKEEYELSIDILPTSPPTNSPTEPPTRPPTDPPIEQPTDVPMWIFPKVTPMPTNLPTPGPSRPPTNSPTAP